MLMWTLHQLGVYFTFKKNPLKKPLHLSVPHACTNIGEYYSCSLELFVFFQNLRLNLGKAGISGMGSASLKNSVLLCTYHPQKKKRTASVPHSPHSPFHSLWKREVPFEEAQFWIKPGLFTHPFPIPKASLIYAFIANTIPTLGNKNYRIYNEIERKTENAKNNGIEITG